MDSQHQTTSSATAMPAALSLLASERPRNVGWRGSAGLLFGDWGTSRLYVLGLAFLFAGRTSYYLIAAMSILILAVGWAYTQICRIYADGGGVYSAARHRSRILGVIGALLLFADYTVTASLSALAAFHYFGLGNQSHAQVAEPPAGQEIILHHPTAAAVREPLFSYRSPGLWAIVSILGIGAINLLGPKHTAGYAVFAAAGMIAITLLVVAFALPQINWSTIDLGSLRQPPLQIWQAFVGIVLALSGVEAIANLTGVMHKPVYHTARKSIWAVALEVAIFNLILAVCMVAVSSLSRQAHKEDMLAFLAGHYVGNWGEIPVRIVGGFLLLSAANTAINGLTSIVYVMSRDGEMPRVFQRLNIFGSPWFAALVAAAVPAVVLLFAHDLETLASLYAIGVVGAVAINVTLCALHPRLRRWWRKTPMLLLGVLMIGIFLTVATTKLHALIFASTILVVGLVIRSLTRYRASQVRKPTLFRQAIIDQLTPEALAKPKFLLATAGSTRLATAALQEARDAGASLVVCYVRPVVLSYMLQAQGKLGLDTDPTAQALFVDFLELGHKHGVPIIPMYDAGPNSAELIAEIAAINGVQKVLIGTSRRGAIYQLIKGSFQRTLEVLLPPEIPVEVLTPIEPAPESTPHPS